MPNVNGWVSDEALIAVKKRAQEKFRGKVSAYISDLIERDLSAQPEPLSPTIMTDLARHLCGELLARELASQIKDADQPKELAKLLYCRASPRWQAPAEAMAKVPADMLTEDEKTRRQALY